MSYVADVSEAEDFFVIKHGEKKHFLVEDVSTERILRNSAPPYYSVLLKRVKKFSRYCNVERQE